MHPLVAIALVGIGVVLLLSVAWGIYGMGKLQGEVNEHRAWRRNVIDRGLAEYRCDPETGKVEFVWKDEGGSGDAR